MTWVFADTCYWIALLNPSDALHTVAIKEGSRRQDIALITSEMVLVEVLNYFAEGSPSARSAAALFVQRLRSEGSVEVIPQTSEQFSQALRLYQERHDKGWSLTDCASMLLMYARGIQQVLTEDHHFRQAGFETLLNRRA